MRCTQGLEYQKPITQSWEEAKESKLDNKSRINEEGKYPIVDTACDCVVEGNLVLEGIYLGMGKSLEQDLAFSEKELREKVRNLRINHGDITFICQGTYEDAGTQEEGSCDRRCFFYEE